MMILLSTLYIGILTLFVLYLGVVLWQIKGMLVAVLQKQVTQHEQVPSLYRDLKQQVVELHQTMGGVVNSLDAVGDQVSNLNLLAGNVLQDSELIEVEMPMAEDETGSSQVHHIMIEIRHNDAANRQLPMEAGTMMSPEDMPPEMQEKFKAFQAIYREVVSNPERPSRQRPDLN